MNNLRSAGRPSAVLVAILFIANSSLTSADGASATLPQTPIRDVNEEHFGTVVSDPYRWLEDTKSPEVIAWLKAQNDYTRSVLDGLPERSSLLARIHTLNDSGITVTGVRLEGRRVFYFKTSPGTNNRRLFVRSGFDGKERLLVDPETLTAEGKHYSIDYFNPSPDGKLVAYSISVIPGCAYAFGIVAHGVKREHTLYAAPLKAMGSAEIPWRLVADVADEVTWLDARADELFLLTHKDSPRFKIIKTSVAHPDLAKATVAVAESDVVIRTFGIAKDAMYVRDLSGGISRLRRYPFPKGKPQVVSLPFEGTLAGLTTDPHRPGAIFAMASWTHSPAWFSLAGGRLQDTHLAPPNPADFSEITSEEVKAPSADGTPVPLSIIYKRGLARDGSHPALVTGYGALGVAFGPYFSPTLLAWLERGGIYAIAHVRGGGDNGEDWHQAGMKLKKQNTIDDFVGCAKYLVERKYTSPPRLAGTGTSAGGITIGGAINQHPELFAAAVDRVGVSDMMRFEISEGGPANTQEFGTIKTADGFKGLYAMSPYHHVKDKTPYPAVLLTSGINDPRVPVSQPAKMAARLQAATSSGKPILLRVDYDAGHGLGSTKSQVEAELTDQFAFLVWQLGASKQIASER